MLCGIRKREFLCAGEAGKDGCHPTHGKRGKSNKSKMNTFPRFSLCHQKSKKFRDTLHSSRACMCLPNRSAKARRVAAEKEAKRQAAMRADVQRQSRRSRCIDQCLDKCLDKCLEYPALTFLQKLRVECYFLVEIGQDTCAGRKPSLINTTRQGKGLSVSFSLTEE